MGPARGRIYSCHSRPGESLDFAEAQMGLNLGLGLRLRLPLLCSSHHCVGLGSEPTKRPLPEGATAKAGKRWVSQTTKGQAVGGVG